MKLSINIFIFIQIYFLSACSSSLGVISKLPEKVSESGKYIFLLHGVNEEKNAETEQYRMLINELSRTSATIITERRGNTEPNLYAQKIKAEIQLLFKNGVRAEDITVVGYAKGAIIALSTSALIKHPKINYILLAGCSDQQIDRYGIPVTRAQGRILSIIEVSASEFGTCAAMLSNNGYVEFKELKLDTGYGDRLFHTDREKLIKLWRNPIVEWSNN